MRKSDYTHEDIKKLAKEKKLIYLGGYHINHASKHIVKCEGCGMVYLQTSRSIISKKNCPHQPCHTKGKLNMLYITKKAIENDIDEVFHETVKPQDYDKKEIFAKDTLIWKKGNNIMTQSWFEVRRRVDYKKGSFFIPDNIRRKPIYGKMNREKIASICEEKNLEIKQLKNVNELSEYFHNTCGETISLRYNQLLNWKEKKCKICYSSSENAISKFNKFLKSKNMYYEGTLKIKDGSIQIDRSQKIIIKCKLCGSKNEARTFDNVRYRGFIYCDNIRCKNRYDENDQVDININNFIELLKRNKISSPHEAQKRFPKVSKRFLKVQNYHSRISTELGWKKNTKSKDFSEEEIKEVFLSLKKYNLKTKKEVYNFIEQDMNNYILRNVGNENIKETVDLCFNNIGIKPRNINIESLEDAINYILENEIDSWTIATSKYPILTKKIIELNLKEDIFKHFNWTNLPVFHTMTDDQLLNVVYNLSKVKNITKLEDIRESNYALVKILKERDLLRKIINIYSIDEKVSWSIYKIDDVINFIKEKNLLSLSDLHSKYSGLYKHISNNDWLEIVTKKCKLGTIMGLDSKRYDSVVEVIVANLLYLNNIEYTSHVYVFRGQKNGKSTADFYIENKFYLEVWGLSYECSSQKTNMPDYLDTRKYKEKLYKKKNMNLCSIEGAIFYKKTELNNYSKGLSAFLEHICLQLRKFNVNIKYNGLLDKKIRNSVSIHLN